MSSINVDTIKNRTGGPPTLSQGVLVSAAATFSTDVSIAGVLTYEDVTNVDSIGIITARSGIKFGAAGIGGTIRANGDTTLAGVVTATSFSGNFSNGTVNTTDLTVVGDVDLQGSGGSSGKDVTFDSSAGKFGLADNTWLYFGSEDLVIYSDGTIGQVTGTLSVGSGITISGNSGVTTFADGSTTTNSLHFGNEGDLKLYHNATNSYIDNSTGHLYLRSNTGIDLTNAAGSKTMIEGTNAGEVSLYYDNTKRIETTSSGAITSGIHTVTVGTDLDGYKVEEGSYDTNALNGEFDFELENGHIQTHTGSTAGTYFPDFRVSSSQSLSSVMDVGDVVTATLIVTASNASHYCTAGIKIDNSTSNVTVEWIGSSAASAGKGAGYDIYTFTIQKTAATPAYLVIVNATDAG
tara:strand:- start:652 stop:1872 length:1221 start_codon:yes stop_codon:yes gene_type:complete